MLNKVIDKLFKIFPHKSNHKPKFVETEERFIDIDDIDWQSISDYLAQELASEMDTARIEQESLWDYLRKKLPDDLVEKIETVRGGEIVYKIMQEVIRLINKFFE